MLKSHGNNNNEKKNEKKKDAVTLMRTHILGIDGPPSEPLRHGDRCNLQINIYIYNKS